MNEIINYLQIATNIFALSVAGIIYGAYIKNLRSSFKLAKEQVSLAREQNSVVEKNLKFYKDKIEDLEKKTPDYLANILNERIKIFEDEINRLAVDRESHKEILIHKNKELIELKDELKKVKEVKDQISGLNDYLEDSLISVDLTEYESGIFVNDLDKYRSVQQLLDDLYVKYLHYEHPPYIYLDTWRFIDCDTNEVLQSQGKDDFRDLAEAGIMGGVRYKVEKINA